MAASTVGGAGAEDRLRPAFDPDLTLAASAAAACDARRAQHDGQCEEVCETRILLPRGVRVCGEAAGLLTRGSPSAAFPARRPVASSRGRLPSQRRDRPGLAPGSLSARRLCGRAYHWPRAGSSAAQRRGLPVVLWAALIFAVSSVPSLDSGLGTWDLGLRKLAHVAEYAVLGALLARALPELAALWAGIAYAASDEVHQSFVPGRFGSLLDVAIDAHGRARRDPGAAAPDAVNAAALDLDGVLGDTRPLWQDWLEDISRRLASIARSSRRLFHTTGAQPPPSSTAGRMQASATGVRRWNGSPPIARPSTSDRTQTRAPRCAGCTRQGVRLGVFTDAPEPLARVALAQLGAARRLEAVETGGDALERLLARLGVGTVVVRSREELRRLRGRARIGRMERGDLSDRQFEAVLERLDRLVAEVARLEPQRAKRRPPAHLARALAPERVARALAYAALGQQAPHVRRRRSAYTRMR